MMWKKSADTHTHVRQAVDFRNKMINGATNDKTKVKLIDKNPILCQYKINFALKYAINWKMKKKRLHGDQVKTSNSNSNKRRLVKWVQPTIYLDLLYDQ